MSQQFDKQREGWGWVHQSPKWHYFVNGRSLCSRWLGLGLGELEQGKDDSPDNCTACKKALQRRKARELTLKLREGDKIAF